MIFIGQSSFVKLFISQTILTSYILLSPLGLSVQKLMLISEFLKSLNSIPFLKLLGKRIYPSPSVKYLGVCLDEHLNWKPHSFEIANKLQTACGALSKLCHYIPLKLLLNVYHAIFSSHMHYACQIWGLRDNSTCHRILTLQKFALRLMTFNAPIFSNLGILKFFELVEVLNILFVHQHSNQGLPKTIYLDKNTTIHL